MNTHTCIKPSCGKSYEDTEIDAYYCPECNIQRKVLAQELDKKYPTVGAKPSGAFQDFETNAKHIKMADGRTASFIRA